MVFCEPDVARRSVDDAVGISVSTVVIHVRLKILLAFWKLFFSVRKLVAANGSSRQNLTKIALSGIPAPLSRFIFGNVKIR